MENATPRAVLSNIHSIKALAGGRFWRVSPSFQATEIRTGLSKYLPAAMGIIGCLGRANHSADIQTDLIHTANDIPHYRCHHNLCPVIFSVGSIHEGSVNRRISDIHTNQ